MYKYMYLVCVIILFSGCFNTSFTQVGKSIDGKKVEITKKDIHIKTKMTKTIFLEPTSPRQQIVYFKFKNTSDEQLQITNEVEKALEKKGFKITHDPTKANFVIQANLLKIGQVDLNEQKNYLNAAVGTGMIGATTTMLTGGDDRSGKMAIASALVGMFVESAKVDDVHFAMVTDVEVIQYNVRSKINNQNYKKYYTKIISSAYGAGLRFEQAKPFFKKGLIKAIAGIM